MIEGEAGGAFNIVVTSIAERIMRADYDLYHSSSGIEGVAFTVVSSDLLTSSWQLGRNELFFVVLLKRRTELGDNIRGE